MYLTNDCPSYGELLPLLTLMHAPKFQCAHCRVPLKAGENKYLSALTALWPATPAAVLGGLVGWIVGGKIAIVIGVVLGLIFEIPVLVFVSAWLIGKFSDISVDRES